MRLSTKEGLLCVDGKYVFVPEADRIAAKLGYVYVERLVEALEQLKPWQLLCPECGMVTEDGGSGHRKRCTKCARDIQVQRMKDYNKIVKEG